MMEKIPLEIDIERRLRKGFLRADAASSTVLGRG